MVYINGMQWTALKRWTALKMSFLVVLMAVAMGAQAWQTGHDSLRLAPDSLRAHRQMDSRADSGQASTVINHIYNASAPEKDNPFDWREMWKDLIVDLCKIVLFPILAAFLPKLFFKESYTPDKFLLVLVTIFVGLILLSIVNNIHLSINHTSTTTTGTVKVDSISFKEGTFLLRQPDPPFTVMRRGGGDSGQLRRLTDTVYVDLLSPVNRRRVTLAISLLFWVFIFLVTGGVVLYGWWYLRRVRVKKRYWPAADAFENMWLQFTRYQDNLTQHNPELMNAVEDFANVAQDVAWAFPGIVAIARRIEKAFRSGNPDRDYYFTNLERIRVMLEEMGKRYGR